MYQKLFFSLTMFFYVFAFIFAAETPKQSADAWKFVFVKAEDSYYHKCLEIYKNGKKTHSLQLTYQIGFMVPLGGGDYCAGEKKYRLVFEGVYNDDIKNFRYQDYLVDITGSGEKRYLIASNFSGGSGGSIQGYLLDAKDDFAILGPIPGGEYYDYPMPNPELIFRFYDYIFALGGQSSGAYAAIYVDLKLRKGKEPAFASVKQKTISLDRITERLYNNNMADARNIALGCLYCELASAGLLQQFRQYAEQLGFTDDEIAKAHEYYRKKIRESKFYKYLKELNPDLL